MPPRPAPAPGAPPPPEVLARFGATGRATLLPGGQARTWRVGDLVLKPVDHEVEHAWVCDVYDAWPADAGVRVPQPVRADDGRWSWQGWGAHHWVPGTTLRPREDVAGFRRTVEAWHDVVAHVPRPAFLDDRDDDWSVGDRVAWGEAAPQGSPATLALLERAMAGITPVGPLPSQVVHGDVAGNVLREPGRPDALIDWPPYHRPRGFALAVAAGDAICWEGAGEELLDAWSDGPDWDQLVLRAVVCRIATRGRHEARGRIDPDDDYVRSRTPSVELALRRAARR